MRLAAKILKRRVSSQREVVVIGGGAMGSSIGLHLALSGLTNVVVIERDKSYRKASSTLSAGGIRQQFSVKENVLMSSYGAEFLKNIHSLGIEDSERPDVQFHENGYLFLASKPEILEENNRLQQSCGVDWVHLFNQSQLKDKFPWLNVNGVSVGSFGSSNEGYFDPWSFITSMKKKASFLGVQFIDGEVVDASVQSTSSTDHSITSVNVRHSSGKIEKVDGRIFVNASGAWASAVMKLFETAVKRSSSTGRIMQLPVTPRKRCIFNIRCPGQKLHPVPPATAPLVIDPTGVYFRPEGQNGRFIAGVSPNEDQDPDCCDADLDIVDHHLFEDTIWPTLYNRVPAFEELKVVGSWAGFYDYNTLDQNAIIGFHCDLKNLVLCNGFSGHGLQQSPAAGRAVAELLTEGGFVSLDLSRFSFDRIVSNLPVFETGIV